MEPSQNLLSGAPLEMENFTPVRINIYNNLGNYKAIVENVHLTEILRTTQEQEAERSISL